MSRAGFGSYGCPDDPPEPFATVHAVRNASLIAASVADPWAAVHADTSSWNANTATMVRMGRAYH